VDSAELNHRTPRTVGILADQCGQVLKDFFTVRRSRR
jgi:hypothetical protein